jgi:hypothetical protein
MLVSHLKDLDRYIEAIAYSDKISQKLTAAGVTEDQLGQEIQKLVVAKAKEIGVTVNPRYGKWDATTADVVAADSLNLQLPPQKSKSNSCKSHNFNVSLKSWIPAFTRWLSWDAEQTHESLLKYLLEESYEFVDAVLIR